MAHTKVYGFCDAKCKVEVSPKADVEKAQSTADGKVSKSGDEMSGTLTFKQSGWNNLTFKHMKYDALNPSGGDERTLNICAYDVGEKLTTSLTTSNNTNFIRTYLATYGYKSDGTRVASSIDIYANRDGTTYVLAPTPSNPTDSSTKIATTSWVNNINNDVVHKSRSETINGTKTFTARPNINRATESGIIYNASDFNRDVTPTNDIIRPWDCIMQASGGVWFGRMTYYVDTHNKRVLSHEIYDTKGTSRLELVSEDGTRYATAPTTPSDANSNQIATANWVNNKLAQKNKVTNVTSYDQLMDLIKNGKRGDSFGITMDYVGGSLGGITASDKEVHAFGHYTIDEITVSDGALTGLQAFGSGEVSGKLKTDDDTTYTYATTGFGRQAIGTGVIDAFRVVEDGKLTYFAPNDDSASISSFEGYYISI